MAKRFSIESDELDRTLFVAYLTVKRYTVTRSQSRDNKNLSIPSTSTAQQSITLSSFDVPDCKIRTKPPASDLLSPSDVSTPDVNKVGQSVFYDCMDMSPISTEKQDDMKPEKSDTDEEFHLISVSEIDQGCTIFSGVTYLGASNINSPKSSTEIQRNMAELNSGSASAGLKVSVSIPSNSEGCVILYDAETSSIIASYEIHRILYCEPGQAGSKQEACFAFTWSHGDTPEFRVYQCHIFRCNIPEAVHQVNSCFAKAFHCYPLSLTGSITSAVGDNNSIMLASITSDISGNPLSSAGYEFIVSLEIREKVTKTSYSSVPRDRSCFKLRCNTDKEVCITVKQTPSTVLQPLYIERCFGVLLSPGKLVRQADMQLLEMISMGYQKSETQTQCLWPYQITAEWKASEKAFEQLNSESQKTYITVAVNLVIKGIQEPVRFVIESPVTIQSQSEIRIMDHFISKRAMSLRFYLQLKKTDDDNWEVSSIDPSEEIIEPPTQFPLLKSINNLSRMVRSTSTVSIEEDFPTEDSSDGDEPLLSGTGEVSKDCSQDTLDEWDPIVKEWDGEKRPKNLPALVRLGIPEALRGRIWQKLANVESKPDITDRYRTLITKETKCETVIQRDIHRTFPAHKRFKETGGSGQDALFKVSKAYAVYDTEVGYCQGLSFIAASLLIHMPEEDAFCVLVSLMYDYGLRDLYKQGFESLYMRLYQLDRLIKEQLPKLHEHFERTGVETHMFASQWFLTLFTARFPLYFVFHVLDVFLLDGVPILFQVAITLLSYCEADLRQLDFEGILKYFRVSLPKKCRTSSQSRKLMKMACERKVKRLKQYEEEFMIKKQIEERQELEARMYEEKFGEERKRFQAEIAQLQQVIEQVNTKALQEEKKHAGIVQDYKQIIQRQEQQTAKLNELLENFTKTVAKCQKCSASIAQSSPEHNIHIDSKKDEQPLGPLDPLHLATQRIRELELELAQTKLAQVEAECKNQDLNHQLNTTLAELQNNRGSWQPWISKTINSIQEKVSTRRDVPTFQSYTNSANQQDPGNQDKQPKSLPHGSPKLRNKVPKYRPQARNSIDVIPKTDHPLLRDTLSLNSMK
ncbi:rab GTPase-activating protein 1-like isoform X3 [Hermetia illucens]|uniref:rab GTPase-activating protein 1-like isoform X3 n=1 Tax=Hermetia illucens TaxID=343691 RepID=UPI0018CC31D1|nr:rab GTPase-activating protein 1-like isoform X3 [Hermetia illucens]